MNDPGAAARLTCNSRVGMGGLVIHCYEPPGHEPPHFEPFAEVSWTMPGEPRVPGVPLVFDMNAVWEAARTAEERGVTADQIIEAIRELKPR